MRLVKRSALRLKQFRRKLRDRLNHRNLQRERAYYDFRFKTAGLRLPDEDTIKAAIKQKHPGIRAKKKGALNILALYHHYNWEDYSFKPALEKFGRVRHHDLCDDTHYGGKDWFGAPRSAKNRELLALTEDRLCEEPIDVIFAYLSGAQILPETAAAISSLGIPIINLCLNDKEYFVGKIQNGFPIGSRDICRYFSLCWTSTEDSLKKYCVEGALPIYLPEGANPDIHKPYDIEKTIDVSFVGQCYGERPGIINKIRSDGIRVEAHGAGWPSGPLPIEEMVKLYSRSRINLGFGGVDSHKDAFCLKGRDFEIPMSGGFYLTEHHPELEKVYRIGSEIATYSGTNDLLQKIRYFLAHPGEIERIRTAGFRRARNEHTWEMRFEKIFRFFGLL